MSRQDLVEALGTIARSGTRAFLEQLAAQSPDKEAKEATSLIGQFGIGFYSSFMVADEVTVDSRRAGESEAWRWTSDGKGAFTIAPLAIEERADARHARHAASQRRLARIRRGLADGAHRARAFRRDRRADRHRRQARRRAAPDRRRRRDLGEGRRSDITPEQYTEFYRSLSGQYDEPALTAHWRAEGRHEYTVLAFIPGSRPFDLFDPARKGRNKLYVRRVLITQDADLLPSWLRFVRLVVDSADLPLNVSREMIQESAVFTAIRKGVTNRIVQELTKLAENEAEKFAKVWEHFGAVIKEGLYEDPERRDALYKIARFTTTTHPAGDRTLADYVKDLAREPDRDLLSHRRGRQAPRRQPAARRFSRPRRRGSAARRSRRRLLGLDARPASRASRSSRSARATPTSRRFRSRRAPSAPAEATAEVATLIAYFKQTLEGEIADARASDRLTDSVACLVAPEFGPDRQLERMLAAHGRVSERVKPVLEVNATPSR